MSLYDSLGGDSAIQSVTADFYQRVIEDERLASFFDGVDMARQSGMLAAFLSMASGGPAAYGGRGLRDAHAGLQITDADFDLVLLHLAATLTAFNVNEEVVRQMAALAGSVRDDVIGRGAPALPAV